MAILKNGMLLVTGVVLGGVGTLLAVAAGWFDPRTAMTSSHEWGEFPYSAKVEMLDDGRTLKLLEDFVYIDPRKKPWVAPKGTIVDGASIPKPFWTIVGGPLEGEYRKASIVHDEGCVRKTESWENVHLMFYEACRCAGLPEKKAKLMYAAVYHFGPRWETKTVSEVKQIIGADGKPKTVTTSKDIAMPVPPPAGEPTERDRALLEKLVNEKNPSLTELARWKPPGQ